MTSITTNRDLYSAISELLGKQKSCERGLEEYLRALWGAGRQFRDLSSLSASAFFELLSSAFTQPAPDFDEQWRQSYDADDCDTPGFRGWESLVLRQIVDLREMAEQGSLSDEYRYFGIKSPRQQHWVNFDPCTFLECATAGSFGGWQPGDDTNRMYVPGEVAVLGEDGKITTCKPEDVPNPIGEIRQVTWDDFRTFLECGQWYE
jgi:hypothetical protein